MKSRHAIAVLFSAFLLSTGCAGSPDRIDIPEDAVDLRVEFSWEGIQPCTHDSPEIRVFDIPEGTDRLRVKLTNLSVPEWNQGGGEVSHDGSGVIPAGALDLGYNGPCPPADKRLRYQFLVMALDPDGAIIGAGRAVQPFPPK
jgi:hypothetical protein